MTVAADRHSEEVPAVVRTAADAARGVVASWAFGAAVLASITGNAIVLGLETYDSAMARWGESAALLQHLFLGLFALELAVRALAYADRPRDFFREAWNVFDLFLLVATLMPFASANASVLRLLRLARILRAARMLPHVRLIASAVGRSLPGTTGFLVVGTLALYLYSMIGWMLFAEADPEHYGSVGRAALTLFLLITLDGLSDMVRTGLSVSEWTVPYYVSFVLFASFVLVNTLIGVVLTSFEEAREATRSADTKRRRERGGRKRRRASVSLRKPESEPETETEPEPKPDPEAAPVPPPTPVPRKEAPVPTPSRSAALARRAAANGSASTRSTASPDPGPDSGQDALRTLFDAFDDDGNGTLSRSELASRFTAAGILDDDPRMERTLAATRGGERELDFDEFASLVREHSGLLRRVLRDDLAVPDFPLLAQEMDELHEELLEVRDGAVADYIPGLARVDPDSFGTALCTVDGQRHLIGDTRTPFCVQSVSKTVSYCLALEEHGIEPTHRHVGREPSGRGFNEVTFNQQGLPHNPMINAGAIMTCSLVHAGADTSDRFEHVEKTWERLAGGRRPGFNNSVYLSERATADRNFALGYLMREQGAFPEDVDLAETLDFYFQCCSIEADADMLSVVAATFANGGVCPLTGERIFKPETVQYCQSLMTSCGMYDFSGQFAFSVGLPAKSGVSGALMVVVPQVMGICVWSPRLDEQGNSVRGVEFCRRMVENYVVHPHDAAEGQSDRRDIRRRKDQTALESVTALCWAAAQGDVDELRRLLATGASPDAGDYDGRTPLHLAAAEGRDEALRFLLDHGADPSRTDRWDNTPQDDAEREGHTETARTLREARPERRSGARPPRRSGERDTRRPGVGRR
ncbi:hypothetical protein GCM10027091_66790 [Streptomyces daliensis]